ncbi:YdbH domain-containing protein [Nitrosococcus oceani]|uniref:YdbH domain-containing protein n=1 Tax=Nitrosococcus oceani TaxID=1229 RepID=UPI000A885107|nr:YdbH domain-containing protein [Nitrosococcus oceani]
MFFVSDVRPVDKYTLHLGDLGGSGWRAEQVALDFQFQTANRGSAQLHIARLLLPSPFKRLQQVAIHCEYIELLSSHLRCAEGTVNFTYEGFFVRSSLFSFSYHLETQALFFELKSLGLVGGSGTIAGHFEDARWQLSISGKSLKLASFLELIASLGLQSAIWPSEFSFQGVLGIEAKLAGQGQFLRTVCLGLQLDGIGFSDTSALQVGEAVAGKLQLKGQNTHKGWEMTGEMKLNGGEAYFHPLYFAFSETPFHAQLELEPGKANGDWKIPHFSLKQTGVMALTGALQWTRQGITEAQAQLAQARVPALYRHWLKPFLAGTALGNLTSGGKVTLAWRYRSPGQWELKGFFDEVDIADQQGRFSLAGLGGQFGWSTHATPLIMDLSWQGGRIYALNLGAAHFLAESKNNGLWLRQSLRLPVLDGQLLINDFVLQDPGTSVAHWGLEGALSPLSMERLSQALGWPALAGKLSGVIPRVRYREGVVEVGGALLVRLFDGTLVIQNLRLEDPLGIIPRLEADIDINRLDLETMTRTFAFGKIEGQLSGEIRKLRLVDWQPVQFDAKLATPEGDPSRHRISQQAVESLSRLGGGASGLVSRSFLGLFNDFSYDKMGLSCRLRRQVCKMGGLGSINGGYYIVRGSGFPRIDIIGYTRRVDWPVFIKRLKRVTSVDGSVRE